MLIDTQELRKLIRLQMEDDENDVCYYNVLTILDIYEDDNFMKSLKEDL